jgi:hypothetical protein
MNAGQLGGNQHRHANHREEAMTDHSAPIYALLLVLPFTASCGGAQPASVQNDAVAGPCNELAIPASITIQAGSGSPPGAAGGTVVDGTYTLSEIDDYNGGDAFTGHPAAGVMVVSAGTMEAAMMDAKGGMDRFSARYMTDGTTIREIGTCGFQDTVTMGYTATASTLTMVQSVPPIVSIFTRN